MAEFINMHSIGDTVVHRYYGVGQIESIESKTLDGIKVEYYKVITNNSTYWFPTDSSDNLHVRPVATEELIQMIIEVLKSSPQGLEHDPFQWKDRIDDVVNDGDLLEISGLVRDLNALKMEKKLTKLQDQALNNLSNRLQREWAAGLQVEEKSIRPKLRMYLETSSENNKIKEK